MSAHAAVGRLMLALVFPFAVTPAVAIIALEPIRSRAAGVAIECTFDSTCAVGELSGDGRYSAADVVAALQIAPADPRDYVRLSVDGDPSISGIFDPSLTFPLDDDDGWMAYSGVDYFSQDGVLVRDVTTRLASSSDAGLSWQTRATLNPPGPMTVTVGNTALCGQPQCEGRMISEVPFLLDDVADPAAQRRFKLFAHRYFVYPPAADRGQDLQRALGSINLRTAPSPDGPWSDDVALLGWNLTPSEIDAAINVNLLSPVMATCAAISEGGAAAFDDELDFVFICPYFSGGTIRQRIVLLRSPDHAASFSFIATVVDDDDAASIGADDLSAPSLFTVAGRTYLLATPVTGTSGAEQYSGCLLVAFSDRHGGSLERDRAGHVIVRQLLPTDGNRFGGACAWDPRAASGILMSQLFFNGPSPSFRLFATGVGGGANLRSPESDDRTIESFRSGRLW